jgi:hypothetical protein
LDRWVDDILNARVDEQESDLFGSHSLVVLGSTGGIYDALWSAEFLMQDQPSPDDSEQLYMSDNHVMDESKVEASPVKKSKEALQEELNAGVYRTRFHQAKITREDYIKEALTSYRLKKEADVIKPGNHKVVRFQSRQDSAKQRSRSVNGRFVKKDHVESSEQQATVYRF